MGLAVALTAAIAAGTALVGAFGTAAQIFRKGGISTGSGGSGLTASAARANLDAWYALRRVALSPAPHTDSREPKAEQEKGCWFWHWRGRGSDTNSQCIAGEQRVDVVPRR